MDIYWDSRSRMKLRAYPNKLERLEISKQTLRNRYLQDCIDPCIINGVVTSKYFIFNIIRG